MNKSFIDKTHYYWRKGNGNEVRKLCKICKKNRQTVAIFFFDFKKLKLILQAKIAISSAI